MHDNVVDIRNLCKIYMFGKQQIVALRDLDLQIPRGDFTAIVGSSGAGKSTLMNIIGCIDRPSSGSILFNGRDTSHCSETERADIRSRMIGFVFQSFNLIPVLSVYENIELPLIVRSDIPERLRQERTRDLIRAVGLEPFSRMSPEQLSGGQRQRVAIARALVAGPAVVIADEPTANLDSETAAGIVNLMLDLNREKKTTFLFSTHDEKLIGKVRRIVVLKDGRIAPGG